MKISCKILTLSVSKTDKYWACVELEEEGFICTKLAQLSEAKYNTLKVGDVVLIPLLALR